MIDVLLVAVLVAAVKLGNWASVAPGPGAVAFASVVILSLLASSAFNPLSIWEQEPQP
jgi:paraquat-inducible protein A